MSRPIFALLGTILLTCTIRAWAADAKPARKYFAHAVVEDRYGAIAPWYRGQNGQCDFRVRIAEETLKRYPWTEPGKSVMPGPHFIFNGCWSIKADGTIGVNPAVNDWDNGDVGQRSISLLLGQTDYYRYSGDPAALGIVAMTANYILDYCQTPADHPWPRLFISCPTKGKAYGRADPHGFIQLDLCALAGSGMIAAYKLTGDGRYWDAAKHWADLLAEHCNYKPGAPPWGRYANPQDVPDVDGTGATWGPANIQTGGIVLILRFLGDVARTGYGGKDGSLLKARDAGEKYLRETLLPQWSRNPTFGHNYWDWANPVYSFGVADYVCDYLMSRCEAFPDWPTDVRNIMSQGFCRLSVNPDSMGGIYSGTWALPEANNCCGKSLQYPTIPGAAVWAQYVHRTDSAWAREIMRRQAILGTYDVHETGVVEDLIDGGIYVAATWFNLAHPWPLKSLLGLMAWQPELTGASRENHIMRSESVVSDVHYGKGKIAYHTFDAIAPSEDVLRLAFAPKSVSADGNPLQQQETLSKNGYAVKPLPNGDCTVTIRHDGCRDVVVEGDDPQQMAEDDRLQYEGFWLVTPWTHASGGMLHASKAAGADAAFEFEGNQVRLIGRADPSGGRADVYLDGVEQLCGIDFWSPVPRDQQVLCYKNGLAQGKHTLKIVALGTKNPYSKGTRVYIDAVQWSAAQGEAGFGEARGPADAQRVIFGYTKRKDYVDSQGHAWRPATEYVIRLGASADLEPIACWTTPKITDVSNSKDAELYRYGVHGRDFTGYFTVEPRSTYHARIKLCQADAPSAPGKLATAIDIQGKTAADDVDIAATAGGLGKAADLVFNDIQPQHGVIAIRFCNRFAGEAMVQAIEIGPGGDEPAAKPIRASVPAKSLSQH
ncbi:MAG: hypothetical protein WCB27_08860 [Thermoguttaceae bacterium]